MSRFFLTYGEANIWPIVGGEAQGHFWKSKRKQLFYHGLCLKGKPWSCGHPVGTLLTDHLTEQTRTDMSANSATGVKE